MNWAVVMTGGRGTRFWPESRNRRPKPFLKLLGRKTLLEETVRRLHPLFPPGRILIVLQDSLVREARKLFPKIPRENILGEPLGRNTAPCCVYAAAQIERRDPEAKIVFLPSDQLIHPVSLYLKTLRTAFRLADEKPVLLGMRPDSPQTGYGYLEAGQRRRIHGISYFSVKRFREKPRLAQARRFLKQGNFFWNGGTFIWRLDAFKRAVRKYAPKICAAWNQLATPSPIPSPPGRGRGSPAGRSGRGERERLRRIYRILPSISLDYAVMEKIRDAHCLLAPFQWSDLGGWIGISEFWPSDAKGNRRRGNAIFIKSNRNIVKGNQRLIALVGAKDLIVVDTDDALLVCDRSHAEEVREVVKEIEKCGATQYL